MQETWYRQAPNVNNIATEQHLRNLHKKHSQHTHYTQTHKGTKIIRYYRLTRSHMLTFILDIVLPK